MRNGINSDIPAGEEPPAHQNGSLSKSTPNYLEGVAQSLSGTRASRQSFEEESERRKSAIQGQIDDLSQQRLMAMVKASEHAGQVGLHYIAKSNWFSRVLITDPEFEYLDNRPQLTAPVLDASQAPALPEPTESSDKGTHPPVISALPLVRAETPLPDLAMPEAPAPPVLPERPRHPEITPRAHVWTRDTHIKSAFAWLCAGLIGLFVGFGLLTLTGLPYQRIADRHNLIFALLIGVAAIAGIKFLFDQMWYPVGRGRALGQRNFALVAAAVMLTPVFITAEAALGAVALVKYSERATFNADHALAFWMAFLIAIAISSANLLFSAFVAYQKGMKGVTDEDIRRREHEEYVRLHEAECRRIQAEHEERLVQWRQDLARFEEVKKRRHDLELARLRERDEAQARDAEVHAKLSDLRLKQIDAAEEDYRKRLELFEERVSGAKNIHDEGTAAQAQRLEEYESYRKLPDFQAMLKYIGIVDSLTVRIEELKGQMTSDSISRGYRKSGVA